MTVDLRDFARTEEINRIKRKTVFCDIDGTLIKHQDDYHYMIERVPELLPGALEFINKMRAEGAIIVITTARLPEHQDITQQQLAEVGILYDHLIMGIGAGERWVINDDKPDMEITARAFVVPRNMGLEPLLNA